MPESRCFGHPECVMTAGYPIGGGLYMCWAHILFSSNWKYFAGRTMVVMPTAEQQRRMAETWNEGDDNVQMDRTRSANDSPNLVNHPFLAANKTK